MHKSKALILKQESDNLFSHTALTEINKKGMYQANESVLANAEMQVKCDELHKREDRPRQKLFVMSQVEANFD